MQLNAVGTAQTAYVECAAWATMKEEIRLITALLLQSQTKTLFSQRLCVTSIRVKT